MMTQEVTSRDISGQKDVRIVSDTITAIMSTRTFSQAAEYLQIERSSLYKRLDKYPQIRESIAQSKQRAMDIINNNAEKAAEVIVDKLDDRRMNFEAAKEVLNRAGVKAQEEKSGNTINNFGNMIMQNRTERGQDEK